MHSHERILVIIVSAYRYIATTTLAIIAVFVEYLGQFSIDFNQIYSVPKKHVSVHFSSFLAQAVSEDGAAATFFCHFVRTTVQGIPRLPRNSIICIN